MFGFWSDFRKILRKKIPTPKPKVEYIFYYFPYPFELRSCVVILSCVISVLSFLFFIAQTRFLFYSICILDYRGLASKILCLG